MVKMHWHILSGKLSRAYRFSIRRDTILARRAGLMHDIGKHYAHDDIIRANNGYWGRICVNREPEGVINAIYAHHGHEEATSIESAAVCATRMLLSELPK